MKKKQLEIFSKILSSGGYDCLMYENTFDFIKDKSNVTEEEFLRIPFSYKSDIRSNDLERRSNNLSSVFGIFGSSGTTGSKTFYKFSMNDRETFDRIASKIMRRAGAKEGDLGIICAPVLDGVMAHTMMWEYTAIGGGYVNCPIPSPDNVLSVVNNVHPTVVSGLPSALDFGLDPAFDIPKDNSIRLFLSGGNFFSNAKRRVIEEKWGLSWFDFLGVSEIFGPIMGECKEKHGLHYDDELFLVEIIDPETMMPIEEGNKIGMLVITPLWNKGSPLVRYWTDDFAYIIDEPCGCGEEGDRIYVLGRKNDYLHINGKYVFPRDLEQVMFSNGCPPDIYVDLDDDGSVVVYSKQMTEEGKGEISTLLGTEPRFVTLLELENMKAHKPSLFSKKIKEHFNK